MSRPQKVSRRPHRRGGFTLVELAIVTMIIGILASVAAPMVRGAILKADAARLVGEAHNLSLATYDYLIETGAFPATAAAGTVPPELADMLSANFPFAYKDVTYQWISITYPDRNNVWNTRNLGILLLNYTTRPEMGDPMAKFAGQDAYWAPTHFYFVYRG